MREESEEMKEMKENLSMKVAEAWRQKHEGRMRNVGVVRMERGEEKREGKGKRGKEFEEIMEEIRPLEREKEKMSLGGGLGGGLGDGWEW